MPSHASRLLSLACTAALSLIHLGASAAAQEAPYIVTYDHHLEEPGSLEIEAYSTAGVPHAPIAGYIAPWVEFEYGVKAWWTAEFYLDGQSTWRDSTIFTGWRLENRFRPLAREHRINPVLYFEYENTSEADKIRKEVVGHSEETDESNAILSAEHSHEIEGKLILSGASHDWNIAGNFIIEKNLSESEATEFGYALAVSRPLSRMAAGRDCHFCPENFVAGVELYGGLGNTEHFGFTDTAQYIAPVIAWQVTDNATLHFSPGFGLTRGSEHSLIRFGYSYEIRGFRDAVASLFRSKK